MFLRLLNISRPRFWMYALGPFLIGVGAFVPINEAVAFNSDIIWWLVYFTLPANLFVYGINDLGDGDTDAFNEKKGTYEERITNSDRNILITAIILLQLPFIPLFLRSSAPELIALLIFFLFNIFYSLPPVRIKAIPFFDSLSNGLFYVTPGIIGYFAAGGKVLWWLPVLSGALWSSVMQAYSAIPDIEADRKAGISTIATVLETKKTLYACLVGYILASLCLVVSGFYIHSLLIIPYLILIGASFYVFNKKGTIFSVYKVYPFVTYVIGALVYYLNTH